MQSTMDISVDLLWWFIKFLIKSLLLHTKEQELIYDVVFENQQLEELHKPIIRKFENQKVYSCFKDNIWGTELADIQLVSKYNRGFQFILPVINIFSKYTCVAGLDKLGFLLQKSLCS